MVCHVFGPASSLRSRSSYQASAAPAATTGTAASSARRSSLRSAGGNARLDSGQEVVEHPLVALRLLHMRHMRALFEQHPFAAGDAVLDDLGLHRGAFVVAAGGDERGDRDLAEPMADVPVLEGADDVELARSV